MHVYVILWTSGECPDDVDQGSVNITETNVTESTYIIESLREGTSYTITVTASNTVGSVNSINGRTQEIGTYN